MVTARNALWAPSCVQTRQVPPSAPAARLRMGLAIETGLGGVSSWVLGFDDDDVGDQILVDATLPEADAE